MTEKRRVFNQKEKSGAESNSVKLDFLIIFTIITIKNRKMMIEDGEVRPEECIYEPYSDISLIWRDMRSEFGYKQVIRHWMKREIGLCLAILY